MKNTDPANVAKIQKSAREFEAVLLSHWLEQAEQSFASVPGSDQDPDQDPGKDQFHAIAMQAVGSALTGGHGGLGIAAMVAKHLQAQAAHKDNRDFTMEINGLTRRPLSGNATGYPKGEEVMIGLKFFLKLPIKQLRGIAGDYI